MFYLPLFFVINPILPIHICQLEQHNQCLQLFHPLIYTWSLISWTGWIITEVLKEILHQPGDVSIYYLYAYIFIRIHIYVNNAYQIKFYSLIAIVYIYMISCITTYHYTEPSIWISGINYQPQFWTVLPTVSARWQLALTVSRRCGSCCRRCMTYLEYHM